MLLGNIKHSNTIHLLKKIIIQQHLFYKLNLMLWMKPNSKRRPLQGTRKSEQIWIYISKLSVIINSKVSKDPEIIAYFLSLYESTYFDHYHHQITISPTGSKPTLSKG